MYRKVDNILLNMRLTRSNKGWGQGDFQDGENDYALIRKY